MQIQRRSCSASRKPAGANAKAPALLPRGDCVSIVGANPLPVMHATQALNENTNTWQSPQAGCRLGDGDVHVWRTRRHWSPAAIARFRDWLSYEERTKADAFHFEADRHRAIVGRGLLRHLLGTSLKRPPDALQILLGLNGKPELVAALDAAPIAFNISHSGDWILVALAQQRAVGVDAEQMRSGMAVLEIAQQVFSEAERTGLAALPPTAREESFFACWTRKEAYIKARGDGLSLPLDSFDVSFRATDAARLLATRPDPGEASRWTLHDLPLGAGYHAAVAAAGSGWQLRQWHVHEHNLFEAHMMPAQL
jgi:4'-phosphopantetheinyl transferase